MKKAKYKNKSLYLIYFFLSLIILFPPSVLANDPPHNEASGVSCGECHGQVLIGDLNPAGPQTPSLNCVYERICARCHSDLYGDYHFNIAPQVKGHNPGQIQECIDNKADPTWFGMPRCIDCHHPHFQSHQTFYGTNDHPEAYEIAVGTKDDQAVQSENTTIGGEPVTLSVINYTGLTLKDGWSLDGLTEKTFDGRGMLFMPKRDDPDGSMMLYFIEGTLQGDDTYSGTIKVKGDLAALWASMWEPSVGSYENIDFAIAYGQAIYREPPFLDDAGGVYQGEPVLFFDNTSTSDDCEEDCVPDNTYSFAHDDGLGPEGATDSTPNGICQVCHTQTDHWRSDGSKTENHFSGWNCTSGCHLHTDGFLHAGTGGAMDCVKCHGHDEGSEYDADFDGSPDAGTSSLGIGTFQSHSTHTETDDDDLKGPGIYCDTCHDTSNMPYFKTGDDANGNNDGNIDLAETDVCNGCHSSGGSYDGLDDPVVGGRQIWSAGAYAATDDSTLHSGKEKWCATCHDEEPSYIQEGASLVYAPNVIGDEDGDYIYGIGWGYYKTGHGLEAGENYPSKGGIETLAGRPVECDSCHDFSTAHIDGDVRTFDCTAVVDGGDGCDSDEYRESYRLQLVDDSNPMEVPWTGPGASSADNFRICVQSGCHDPGPFTDPDNPNTNLKTVSAVKISSDPDVYENRLYNRHTYHLNFEYQNRYPADWIFEYTSDPVRLKTNSRISCVTCHNVHGSTQLAMVRDGKLIDRVDGLEMWYMNDDFVEYNKNNQTPPDPENLPLAASTGNIWKGGSSARLCTH